MMSHIGHTFVCNDPTKAVSFNPMKKRVMVCTHCTGGGLGPVQGPNGKYGVVPYRNAHTSPRQGQTARSIVFYCTSCAAWTGPGPRKACSFCFVLL